MYVYVNTTFDRTRGEKDLTRAFIYKCIKIYIYCHDIIVSSLHNNHTKKYFKKNKNNFFLRCGENFNNTQHKIIIFLIFKKKYKFVLWDELLLRVFFYRWAKYEKRCHLGQVLPRIHGIQKTNRARQWLHRCYSVSCASVRATERNWKNLYYFFLYGWMWEQFEPKITKRHKNPN